MLILKKKALHLCIIIYPICEMNECRDLKIFLENKDFCNWVVAVLTNNYDKTKNWKSISMA